MNKNIPKELSIQDAIRAALEKNYEVYPYNILYVDYQQSTLPLLKITVWVDEDLNIIKNIINYVNLCDKTGFLEFPDTNTIILRGYALLSLMRALNIVD